MPALGIIVKHTPAAKRGWEGHAHAWSSVILPVRTAALMPTRAFASLLFFEATPATPPNSDRQGKSLKTSPERVDPPRM